MRELVILVGLCVTVTGCTTAGDEPDFDAFVAPSSTPAPDVSGSGPTPSSSPTASLRPRRSRNSPRPAGVPPEALNIERYGVTYARAKAVMQRYKDTIWNRYQGVQGIGITSVVSQRDLRYAGDRIYGILVFLKDSDGLPKTPQSIAGVPLKFKVSGPFSILPAPAG